MVHSIDINGISGQASALLSGSGARPPVAIGAPRDQSTKALSAAIHALQDWIEERDYAGHEPYDILNSPLLRARWFRPLPVQWSFIQIGKRGATRLRKMLRVPPSKNPKALGLML